MLSMNYRLLPGCKGMFYIRKGFLFFLILNPVIITALYYSTQQPRINYHKGLSLFQRGEFEESIPYFKKVADKSTSFPETFKYLGLSMQWGGHYEPALENFDRYLHLKPDSFEALKGMAQIHAWKKEYEPAVEKYKKLLRLKNDEEALRELAQVYSWSGSYDQAEKIYKSLLLKNPDDPSLYYALSELMNWRGDSREALTFIEKGVELSGENNMRLLYAETLFYSGNFSAAREIVNTLIEEDSSNDKARLLLGNVLVGLKEFPEALSLYQEMNKKNPLAVLKELASAYYYNSQFSESIPLFEKHLKSFPEDAESRLLLANAFRFTGRTQEAISCYEGLLSHSGESRKKESESALGEAYLQKGDWNSAIRLFQGILMKEPDNIAARIRLAETHSWIKQYPEAIEHFQKVLSLDPQSIEAREKMARVLKWNKEYKKAEALFKEVLKQDPSKIYLYTELAELLIWDNRSREALPLFTFMKNHSQDKESYELLLAQALHHSGDFSGSKEVYLKILHSFPKDRKAKQGLADSYAYSKEYEKSIALYKELLALAPDREIQKQLALVLSWAGRHADSILLITDILKSEPGDSKLKILLARNYMYSGQAAKAIPLLKELEKSKERRAPSDEL